MRAWKSVSRAILCAAAAFGFALGLQSSGAAAQSLQWGIWGEPPETSRLGGFSTAALPKGPDLSKPGPRPEIVPQKPKTVTFANGMKPGSIIIDTATRKLYYTLSDAQAYVYPIAVGKEGFTWTGVESVSRIVDWPDWIPPPEMHKRKPGLPERMAGGLNNPLGARAIYLGNTLYRIHGTNDPKSIGSASSSGCFRMNNAHVVHLAGLVGSGTTVYVMKALPKSGIVMPPAAPPAAAVATSGSEAAPAKEQTTAPSSAPSPAEGGAAGSGPQPGTAGTPDAKEPAAPAAPAAAPAGDAQKI